MNENNTIAAVLHVAIDQLHVCSDSARLDGETLLAHCLGRSRTDLYTWPETILAASEHARYRAAIARRLQGEPVAYITGQRAFWTLDLAVDSRALIPRCETEQLVEWILEQYDNTVPRRVVDLGTGSGAIALSLARERSSWQLIATDCSAAALAVAQHNAKKSALPRVQFIQGRWLAMFAPGALFDIIVSNPPYIAVQDKALQQCGLPYEPVKALTAGQTGLDALNEIATTARHYLKPGGQLVLEHGYDQGERMVKTLQKFGYRSVESYRDLQNHPRMVVGCYDG